MPIPVITNPYTVDHPLTGYVNEPFIRNQQDVDNNMVQPLPVRIPISNSPTSFRITGNWVGWKSRWISADQEIELILTPKGLLVDLTGIKIEASNPDGSATPAYIPYKVISRPPVIASIPDKIFTKGQTEVDYTIEIQNQPILAFINGDLIGLEYVLTATETGHVVRIFGDIADGELPNVTGTYTLDASNETGDATPKTGNWFIESVPLQPYNVVISSAYQQLTITWDEIQSYPPLSQTQVRISTSQAGLSAASWTTLTSQESTNRQYTFTNLTTGTTYYVQLRGINSQGNGAISDAVSAAPAIVASSVPQTLILAHGDSQIVATWQAPVSDGGSTILRYEVELDDDGTWINAGTDLTHTFTGLTNGTEYSVKVRAVNAIGNSPETAAVTATPGDVPNASTGLALSVSDSQIIATWLAATDDGGYSITRYEVELDDSGTWTDAGTNLTHTFTGLTNGTSYSVRVRAVNAIGNGDESAPVTGIPVAIPSAPGISITAGNAQIDGAITAPDDGGSAITAYQYAYKLTTDTLWGSWTNTSPAGSTSFTITGLTNATSYDVKVRAVNAVGNSPDSTVQSATPAAVPTAAQSVLLTPTGTQILATWQAPADTGGYPILRYEVELDDSGTWINSGTDLTHTFTGLSKGTTYSVKVRAVNIIGDGNASTAVSATVPTTVPIAPSLAIEAGNAQIDGTITAPADNGGSAITAYEYRYKTTAAATWGAWTDNGTSLTFTISSLTNGTSYDVQARAVNAVGNSLSSATQTATPTAVSVPDTPTLSLSAGNTQIFGTITAGGTGGSPITALQFQYKATTDATWGAWVDATLSDGTFTISLLTNGTSYDVRARAVNAIGNSGLTATESVTPAIFVVVVDSSLDRIGIFSTAGSNGSTLSPEKYLNLPSGWGNPQGITRIAANKVAILDASRNDIGVFDISGANESEATLDKYLNLSWSSDLRGLTQISENKIAVLRSPLNDTHRIGIFDISGGNNTNATLDKQLYLPSNYTRSRGITKIAENKVAVIDFSLDDIGIFNISGANNANLSDEKTLNLPSSFAISVGITYIGNDKVAIVDTDYDDIGIFDISGANNANLSAEKTLSLPSGWSNPSGIALF